MKNSWLLRTASRRQCVRANGEGLGQAPLGIRATALLVAVLTAGCASGGTAPPSAVAPAPAQTAPAAAATTKPATATLPDSIRWMQNSAEYVAIATQTYRLATVRVETDARGRAAGTWGVILDADDTVINNIAYQAGLFRDGVTHTPERFTAFVRQRVSTAVPGAGAFLTRVHALGGRIGIVTNRLQIECDDTAEMLRQLSMPFDAVVCRPEGAPSSAPKTPRYQAIAAGLTAVSRTPIDILVFVGDNIMDFPDGSQAWRARGEAAFSEFGVRWFALPNPMYGSWQ
jgi:5'-nucleotidase (lipoprotein e(P4) family)